VEIDMSERSEVTVSSTRLSTTPQRNGLLEGVSQLAHAWVGLWSIASDDLGDFYHRCVARGEQRLDGQPPASDVVVTQPKTAVSRRIQPLSIVNAFGAVESYHIDLNVEGILPTRQELDALTERVEALSREVESLAQQRKQED
jgi:polyhydroxyalkanoate synthesis regulator phasin